MTYKDLFIPYAREYSSYESGERQFLKAHAKELKRRSAKAWNWGWVIVKTGICTKTDKGVLETSIRNGTITHTWNVA